MLHGWACDLGARKFWEAAVRRLGSGGTPGLDETAARVAAGETDPWTAAARLTG